MFLARRSGGSISPAIQWLIDTGINVHGWDLDKREMSYHLSGYEEGDEEADVVVPE